MTQPTMPQDEPRIAAAELLELIPPGVRRKLDRVAIKLHLREWQALSLADRALLRDLPCEDDAAAQRYAAEIERLLLRVTGKRPEVLDQRVERKV